MTLKHTIFIALILGLFSCSYNQTQKEKLQELNPTNIVWIETTDSITNFEALLSTNHLSHLRHMSADYDNYGKDFWKSIDTIKNDNWTFTRFREGACQESRDSSKINLCIERQEHTINKENNKVVRFSGNGSGYFADIEYVYDEFGKLIEYKDNNKVFYLKYNPKNQLTEIVKTEISHGVKMNTGLIKFK